MSSNKDGIMLILSSPSGAGKTTLVKQLSKNKDFHISVSHTTRKPRRNEIQDEDYHLVVLDELTYMLSFKYLDEDKIIDSLKNRPISQSVVVTGRGGGSALVEWADTVSEIKERKHAYNQGIMAQKGVDL